MKKELLRYLHLIALLLLVHPMIAQDCIVPDNGTGTATLPPMGCTYTCPNDPFMIIDGLPPGTTLMLWGTLKDFSCCPEGCDMCSLMLPPGVCEGPGGFFGGDGQCFEAIMEFQVIGTGELTGYERTLDMPMFCEIHTGERFPGEPVQQFPGLIFTMNGQISGDPDFSWLQLTAGEFFGLPCPGDYTMEYYDPDWWVESFFDVTYQLEFEGSPGSILEGFAGVTTETTQITTGGGGGGGAVSDLFLLIGAWHNPEPWHDWIGGMENATRVQLLLNDPENEILEVSFYYSIEGSAYEPFYTDTDGTQPDLSTFECSTTDGDGWSAYLPHEMFPPEDFVLDVMAQALATNGTVYEAYASTNFDPSPPDGIQTNITDWMIIEDNEILLEVEPGSCSDLDYIWVELEPKVDSFSKGIPPISQQPHSSSHCSPTAAASCLKYFENQGDGDICGSLSDHDLVDSLADRFHTNQGHWGTYLSDIANGLREWISDHGGGYTVRGPKNCDWNEMRNELERCQDVISSIFWDGGCGHSMTFNSVVNTPNPDGTIEVDFMDPWTGEIEWGTLNPSTGHVSGFTGAGSSGTLGDVIYVCPEESSPNPGGGTVYPGPFPGGITIPVPGDGLYFLRIISVDAQNHAARHDYVIKKVTPPSNVGDLHLRIDDWINPEPWHDFFDNLDPTTPVQLLASDPDHEITEVVFEYSIDGGPAEIFYVDQDGTEPEEDTQGTSTGDGDGWTGYFNNDLIGATTDAQVTFYAHAYLTNGEIKTVERTTTFDPSSPAGAELNVEDWMIIQDDQILLEVAPGQCTDIDRIIIDVVPKADTFAKGIPTISQQPHSTTHCAPTAAAACLKYFESQGDNQICGGLDDHALVDSLADRCNTNKGVSGTKPSDLANGMLDWIQDHGDNYTVRGPMAFNWQQMRNELERCQDVLTGIYWPNGGGHRMTFNSIINRPLPNGNIKVDFMDPWTGEIEYGELNPSTGQLTNFESTSGDSGELGNIIIVCPKETQPDPGSGTTYPWPADPIPIELYDPGLYFLRVIIIDDSEHKARFDLVMDKIQQPQVGDLFLRIGPWWNPEPWHDWFGGIDTLKLQLHAWNPLNEILSVDFLYSMDGTNWTLFDSDSDGSIPHEATIGLLDDTGGDGWAAYFPVNLLPQNDAEVFFKAEATLTNGEVMSVENSSHYDPTPPSGADMNVYDWMIIEGDNLLLDVGPGSCTDLQYIEFNVTAKADTFQKGIPPINANIDTVPSSCAPTAATACFKYFEDSIPDNQLCGGLGNVGLMHELAVRCQTNKEGSGTSPDDLADGMESWIKDHGDNYTVRGPMDFNWTTVRNELERCQDVLMGIYWIGDDDKRHGHRMTMNSIVNREEDGKIRVDFMDPYTGEIEWGNYESQYTGGLLTSFTGVTSNSTMDNVIIVCPKETSVTPGTGTQLPGPDPDPASIQIIDPGLYFLRIQVVDQSGHKARYDLIVEKLPPLINQIIPGTDHWMVPCGKASIHDEGAIPTIPADFFGPGSDPFTGTVHFRGQSSQGAQLPLGDVIFDRPDTLPFDPPPSNETIPIEMIELGLVSTEPISVDINGQPTQWDVEVSLSPDNPSAGSNQLSIADMFGGSFTKSFDAWLKLTFTNVSDPTDVRTLVPEEPVPFSSVDATGFQLTESSPLNYDFSPLSETHVLTSGSDLLLVLDPLPLRDDFFYLGMDESGQPEFFEGTGYNNGTWYFYPNYEWWNVWFYDHPFDTTRSKQITGQLMIEPRNPDMQSYVKIVFNWTTGRWPAYNEIQQPPLPEDVPDPVTEDLYIVRSATIEEFSGTIYNPIPIDIDFTIEEYNPEWLSVDVMGYNFILSGNTRHICFKKGSCPRQDLIFFQGWSGVSSYLEPFDSDVENLFSSVMDDLVILYNSEGMLWPDQGINTIIDWDVYDGYVAKTTADFMLPVYGSELTNRDVAVGQGWSLIPVFADVPAADVFGSLTELVVAKEVAGNKIWWDNFGIYTLNQLHTGSAYYVLMSTDAVISYPPSASKATVEPAEQTVIDSPWNDVNYTPYSHLIAFEKGSLGELSNGDIIGAFTPEGRCAGIMQVIDPDQPHALTLMGDDPFTLGKDGFAQDDVLIFKSYDNSKDESCSIEITWNDDYYANGTFSVNALSAAQKLSTGDHALSHYDVDRLRIYPNPGKDRFHISGVEGKAVIEIVNTFGTTVFKQPVNLPGMIDTGSLPPGIYLVKTHLGGKTYVNKLMIR